MVVQTRFFSCGFSISHANSAHRPSSVRCARSRRPPGTGGPRVRIPPSSGESTNFRFLSRRRPLFDRMISLPSRRRGPARTDPCLPPIGPIRDGPRGAEKFQKSAGETHRKPRRRGSRKERPGQAGCGATVIVIRTPDVSLTGSAYDFTRGSGFYLGPGLSCRADGGNQFFCGGGHSGR